MSKIKVHEIVEREFSYSGTDDLDYIIVKIDDNGNAISQMALTKPEARQLQEELGLLYLSAS